MERKKILFFLAALDLGGIETVFLRLINGIDRKKYNVKVICLYNFGRLIKELPEDIEYSYIFSGRMFIRGYTYFYKYFPITKIANKCFKGDYDVIIAYGEGPITNLLSKYKGKAKKISWLHREYSEKELDFLYGGIKKARKIYQSFDKVVCVAQDTENGLLDCIPNLSNTMTLYNPIDNRKIIELSKEKVEDIKFDSGVINLISVARFRKEKGYLRLLRVLNKLKKEGIDNFHLYLIGEGPEEACYNKYIEINGLKKNVTIIGYRSNPLKYVAMADVYVCSSYREGFSTSVVEALILEKLVITTECSGMKEIFGNRNEYGIVVDNSEDGLYEGLKNIITSQHYYDLYKEKIKERAKIFDYNTLMKKIEDCIDKI